MKKLILGTIILLLLVTGAKAQKEQIFRKFKGDVAFGFALPGGTGTKGGVLFAMEPKYTFFDKLAVGLRIETALMATGLEYDNNGDLTDPKVQVTASYLATADYYFTNTKMRPFVGAGAGLYSFAFSVPDFANYSSDNTISDTKFGGMFRAGFEVGHFRFGLEYNLVPKSNYNYVDFNDGLVKAGVNKNGYFSLKVGAFFGGGRLEKLKKKHRRDD